MRSDITPDGTFPDYELPDHDNIPRRLRELRGADTHHTSQEFRNSRGGTAIEVQIDVVETRGLPRPCSARRLNWVASNPPPDNPGTAL